MPRPLHASPCGGAPPLHPGGFYGAGSPSTHLQALRESMAKPCSRGAPALGGCGGAAPQKKQGRVGAPPLALQNDVEHYRQEVKERPQQNEDMKQFVEAEDR